jgi:type II secretion system protein J
MRRAERLRARRPRAGFTLVELLVAIMITSVIALLAYGSARAAFDTDDRLARARSAVEGAGAMRALVSDALRHAVPAVSDDQLAFELQAGTRADDLPADRVRFVSRGLVPPLGAGTAWLVTVGVAADGLVVDAVPVTGDAAPVRALVPGVAGLRVRALASDGGAWARAWDAPARLPRGVELRLLRADGALAGAPIVVALDAAAAP